MNRHRNPVHSQFQRGSGVYVCRACHVRTRGTHRGEAALRLCVLCYWKRNAVTVLHQAGYSEHSHAFEDCRTPESVAILLNEILCGDIDVMPETHKIKGGNTAKQKES